ncbi:pentapeptide repeat-containing protein [Enterococcus sp. BWB1-3]|uniref:pentapeptide repeat-containing protein n=1 Tax=Enterococcus sp. BWB1-3 TaxID=2787713 RepID=UPI001922EB04|nr:pentapeptide repeat-containing protein [Enterococcus sp. BWB1-3]MBL1229845.1 pentapeptide repeat-containing protein [Enterococcus sp. BWB1-3]
MIVTETIKQFQREYVEPLVIRLIHQLDQEFRSEKDQLIKEFEKDLIPIFMELHEKQRNQEVSATSFLVFSWLRGEYLFEEALNYEVHSYGENWYFSTKQFSQIIKFDWLSPYLYQFKEQLRIGLEEQKNPGLLGQEDYYLNSYYEVFQQYFIALLRWLFRKNGEKLLSLMSINKRLLIYAGEYKDACERIYEKNEDVIAQEELDYLLDVSQMDFEVNKVLKNSSFKNQDFSNLNLTWGDYHSCDFRETKLTEALLVGSQFNYSTLNGADFRHSRIQDTSFRYAECQNADFQFARGSVASTIEAIPCYFGVDFSHANLTNADFRGAKMNGAVFEGAKMTGARFFEYERTNLVLTDQQQEEIRWVSG